MIDAISEEQLIKALNWRYGTKTFDPSRIIPEATWKTLEETLILSLSSYGLQPYRFLVVKDPAVRKQLLNSSWNQAKVVEASHYVVFAARTAITKAEIDCYIDRIIEVRGEPPKILENLRRTMYDTLLSPGMESCIPHWTAQQSHVALGTLVTAASLIQIDSCPIGSFVPAEYDQILGLKEQGYRSVVGCALGYRSAEDRFAALAKIRKPASELIKTI